MKMNHKVRVLCLWMGAAVGLLVAVPCITSCVTHKRGGSDYGEFPEVQLLQQSQAKQIKWAAKGQLHGRIEKADWDAIMVILSRIPNLNDSQRELVNVVCYGDPTIGVCVQLGYDTIVQFVKTGRATWRIAGLYHFAT